MHMSRNLAAAALALLAALSVPGAARAAAPERWAVVADEAVSSSGLVDLLDVELGTMPGVSVLERAHIARIMAEQQVVGLADADAGAERVKLGRLLNADRLLLLAADPTAAKPRMRVTICDTAQGTRLLTDLAAAPAADLQGTLKDTLAFAAETRARFANGVKTIVGVLPFTSRDFLHAQDGQQRALYELLQQALTSCPGVAVIEVAEAAAIGEELAGQALADRPAPVIVTGEFKSTPGGGGGGGTNDAARFSVTVTVKGAREVLRTLTRGGMASADVERWFRGEVTPAILELLKTVPDTERLSPEHQFKAFTARAERLARLAAFQESIGLREAALLLKPEQANMRTALLREYMLAIRDTYHGRVTLETDAKQAIPMWITAGAHLENLVRRRQIDKAAACSLLEQWLRALYTYRAVGCHLLKDCEPYRKRYLINLYKPIATLDVDPANRLRSQSVDGFFLQQLLIRLDGNFRNHEDLEGAWDLVRQMDPDHALGSQSWASLTLGIRTETETGRDIFVRRLKSHPNARFAATGRLADCVRRYKAIKGTDKVGPGMLADARACIQGLHNAGAHDFYMRSHCETLLREIQRDMERFHPTEPGALPLELVKAPPAKQYAALIRALLDPRGKAAVRVAAARDLLALFDRAGDTLALPGGDDGMRRRRETLRAVMASGGAPVMAPPLTLSCPLLRAASKPELEHELAAFQLRRADGTLMPEPLAEHRLANAGKVDVFWSVERLLLHRDPWILTEILHDKQAHIVDVRWDGQHLWVGTTLDGVWLVDLGGRRLGRIGADEGLPPVAREVWRYDGARPMYVQPLGRKRAIAVGMVQKPGNSRSPVRTWCALLDFGSVPPCARVFHEAKRILTGSETPEPLLNEPAMAFVPTGIRLCPDPGTGRPTVYVSRQSHDRLYRVREHPLRIDADTLAVSVAGTAPPTVKPLPPDYEPLRGLLNDAHPANSGTKWSASAVVGPLFHHVSGGLYQRVKWKPGDGLPRLCLFVAAAQGHAASVGRAIGAGDDLEAGDQLTPLGWACLGGHVEVAQQLLDAGADPGGRADGNNGWTPLHAVMLGRAHGDRLSALTAMLLKAGADPNAPDARGYTPLFAAIQRTPGDGPRLLLDAGADAAVAGADGRTPLHKAAMRGLTPLLEPLVKAGGDVNARDKWGQTPLHITVWYTRPMPGFIETLVRLGADITARDAIGNTPLHLALWAGKSPHLALLTP
jgi:hypothetical protein